jgi:hypothetical protein
MKIVAFPIVQQGMARMIAEKEDDRLQTALRAVNGFVIRKSLSIFGIIAAHFALLC